MKNLLLVILAHVVFTAARDCSLVSTTERIIVQNGYVHLEFNLAHPQIDIVSADFQGNGNYGLNLMAHGSAEDNHLFRYGIVLEHDVKQGASISTTASSRGKGSLQRSNVITNTTTTITFQVLNVVDDFEAPTVSSNWTITLNAGQRYFTLDIKASALVSSANTISVRIGQYFSPTNSVGQFDRGVQQMMNSTNHYFKTSERLFQYFTLGSTGSVTIQADSAQKVQLSSSYYDLFFRSGMMHILFGNFPSIENQWSNIEMVPVTPLQPTLLINTLHETILVNDFDFPVVHPYQNDDSGVSMPIEHIRSLHTGVYAAAVSGLLSFDFPEGVISPTVAAPQRAYWPLFNFYDPDAWMSGSALLYMADPYLFNETRKVLDTTLRYMQPDGLVPHHFIGDPPRIKPIYEAISGATQTGPNIFWALGALNYVKASGDYSWLKQNMKGIEKVVDFIISRYNPDFQLIKAPGPLQIDCFIRTNYTSDTNAMVTFLLTEMAEAEEFLVNTELMNKYRQMSSNITQGMNRWLWLDDHYITQINDDMSTRDFIDYDANFLAVAFGIPSTKERSAAIMKRLMNGTCTNANVKGGKPRAAYVSEKFYDDKVYLCLLVVNLK
jgi:hypothetical protein